MRAPSARYLIALHLDQCRACCRAGILSSCCARFRQRTWTRSLPTHRPWRTALRHPHEVPCAGSPPTLRRTQCRFSRGIHHYMIFLRRSALIRARLNLRSTAERPTKMALPRLATLVSIAFLLGASMPASFTGKRQACATWRTACQGTESQLIDRFLDCALCVYTKYRTLFKRGLVPLDFWRCPPMLKAALGLFRLDVGSLVYLLAMCMPDGTV